MKKKKINSKPPVQQEIRESKPLIDFRYIAIILFAVFCFLLFKNISYPLLWNDESDTAMTAKQVLKYGYPKVHDGKNIIFLPDDPTWIGYKKSIDANIARTWGDFYFGAIGVFLAGHTDDMYLKSALSRIPFAAAGLLGLLVFLISFKNLFPDKKTFYRMAAAFFLMELFSTALFLHLRTGRYYALVIFITACFFYVFIQYFLMNRYSFKKYFWMMVLVLFIAYHINFVMIPAFCMAVGIYEAWQRTVEALPRIKKEKLFFLLKEQFLIALKNLSPLFAVLVLIAPFVVFFETFDSAARAAAFYNLDSKKYIDNLARLVHVFKTQEFFYAFLFAKALQLIIWYLSRKEINKKTILPENNFHKLSFFMLVFSFCYILMTAKMPLLWERYYIVLQPVMVLMLLADIYIIYKYIASRQKNQKFLKLSFSGALIIFFAINYDIKTGYIKDYWYQLTHQYKGPLDYIIPYIKENYKKPEDLVIATNYEELSYIYFLDSKITIGYINKNIEEDLKYQPDIIIFRKSWGQNPKYFNDLINKAKYERVTFPVADYPVNDIAELDFGIQHLFRTKLAATEQEKVEMFVRTK